MAEYIATFYSHFGAVRFKKICDRAGWPARMMPVPRGLSSSCGTCVRYEGSTLCPKDNIPEEAEQIVLANENNYIPVYRAENS